MKNEINILADIGGTYARFALESDEHLKDVRKYKAGDFESFDDALTLYCKESGVDAPCSLSIATAGYEDQGVWKFVNQNKWEINPAALKKKGWSLPIILNDFEAATWSLLSLDKEEKLTLRDGQGATDSLCLLGPGTGLGLGYLHQGKTNYVQKTHGGHMPATSITEEQWLVIQTLQRLNRGKTTTVFEHLVSGPGLFNIYAALCLMAGKIRHISETEQLLEHRDDPEVKNTLRLFHEFMGLFAVNAVVTGNAYGGLYLTGGVLERLHTYGAFDVGHFLKFFDLGLASSVKRDLALTPISFITIPNPALKGLRVVKNA
jgi:glucokinase